MKFGLNHSGFIAEITFTSNLDGDTDVASWGICDVQIEITFGSVDADGNELGTPQPVIFSCESPVSDPYWIYTPSFQTKSCSDGNTYVGGYGSSDSIVSSLRVSDPHKGIIMKLKLALFDTWDDGAFLIYADASPVYSYTYSSDGEDNICESSTWSSYVDVQLGFNHSASSLSLEFTSYLPQSSKEGTWGVCDLEIYPVNVYVDMNGNPL